MSDFLLTIADHLNRTPTLCACGHPSILHLPDWGCTARWEHDSGSDPCACDDEHDSAMRQWEIDHPGGVISDEEMRSMDEYAAQACREEGCR